MRRFEEAAAPRPPGMAKGSAPKRAGGVPAATVTTSSGQERASDDSDRPSPVPGDSRWRLLELERVGGGFSRSLLLFERTDQETDPEDVEYRLWCEEVLEGEPWSFIPEVFWEAGGLEIIFSPDKYTRMPGRLKLEKPRRPAVGAVMRMFGEDGRVFASFRVRATEELSGKALGHREPMRSRG